MKRFVRGGLVALACLVALGTAGQAFALRIAPSPIPQRVATTDVVVVGKVTKVEDKTVEATAFPGQTDKMQYKIAVVKIEDGIAGAKGLTHVRVGMIQQPMGGPGGPIRPGIGRGGPPALEQDQEVLLFLTQHHDGNFYTAPAYFSVVQKKGNENFAKEVEQAQKAAKLLADPKAGLTDKDAANRYETASLLIQKYRGYRPSANEPKQEEIPAEESKLIMKALAEADWAPKVAPRFDGPTQPIALFGQLGITDKDGFKQPTTPEEAQKYQENAKKWVADNAEKYRIKKLVFTAPKKD